MLETAGLTGAFQVTLSTEEVPRGKPAPDVYLAAAARSDSTPAVCAAVEDSSNGLRAAAAAGLAVICVPHGVYPPARRRSGAGRPGGRPLDELTVEAVREAALTRDW